VKAVILAGGEGRRLLPYTTAFPKPLMPVGRQPILELILRQLKHHGVAEAIVATGHLDGLIRAYFQDGGGVGLPLRYSREDRPLGTAGPLSLLRSQLLETFLLMNGDVLTDLDFTRLRAIHASERNDVTVVLTHRTQHVDFGVVTVTRDGDFDTWDEQPDLRYLVSAGIYMMQPDVLSLVPDNAFLTLPDFIVALKAAGRRVRGYVHDGYWLDIGRPDDYERACADIDRVQWW
jgi:NDP-sugar pyrophosphorylase family protein